MRRLRIGYLVPGHHLVPTAGPTRNVLSLAAALSELADVTVAFRRIAEPPVDAPFEVHALEPGDPPVGLVDDAAVRGTSAANLLAYTRTLREYAAGHDFDVVLEKTWLLSGYLASVYRRTGVPGAVVENNVRVWRGGPPRGARGARGAGGAGGTRAALRARLSHTVAGVAVRRWLPRADAVIAETEALRRALVRHMGVAEARVTVVGLGVDHELFRPTDRADARARLGLAPDARILLYFGVLDATHDLTAVLTAAREAAVEVHVVGDGERRGDYERIARGAPVRFHGRVPHAEVPTYIAAADLCLAPYAHASFTDGEIDYFTLKIPEAMACGRPVVSVPAEQTRALIEHGESGFLIEDTPAAWAELMRALPPLTQLDQMGARARERAASITWRNTAKGYLAVCEQVAFGPRT